MGDDMKGQIFNIMKYAVHDGPGIRTTVFLKGCPLNCWWCHNPESQELNPQLTFFPNRCIGCMDCVSACKENAISIVDGKVVTDLSKCKNNGDCTLVCFAEAREMAGKSMSVDEVVKEILKDKIFYDESGGGVTFSGGEPLMQSKFLLEVLKKVKDLGIHTTLDTCGFATKEVLEEVSQYIDLFLFDLKHMDNDKHEKYTGVTNNLILENLTLLDNMGKDIVIRVPVIPGFNDKKEELEDLKAFISSLQNIKEVNLLPYHSIGQEKYNRIGKEYKMKDVKEPSDEDMGFALKLMDGCGVKVKIGG